METVLKRKILISAVLLLFILSLQKSSRWKEERLRGSSGTRPLILLSIPSHADRSFKADDSKNQLDEGEEGGAAEAWGAV